MKGKSLLVGMGVLGLALAAGEIRGQLRHSDRK
jgi:hypothetical protein